MLFVAPRLEQARTFCHARLLPCLKQSPLVRRMLVGSTSRMPLSNMAFENGSKLYVRAAFHDADGCRGLSVRRLFVDEYQDIAPNDLAVLQETMSHAKDGRTFLTGTPKLIDNHLEAAFSASTANEWTIPCRQCGQGVVLDQRCLGPSGILCPGCRGPINPRDGAWVARNPRTTWGDGFWICHPMVPWLNYDEILERQRVYDLACFKNECLGLPSSLGDHVVTRAEIELCCEQFNVRLIAADGGGNGHVYNRLLFDKLKGRGIIYAILYSDAGQAPRQDGALWKWTVGRSRSLGGVFSRIKKQMILFPHVRQSGSFLDEFACEVFEYDDDQRSGRFTHPKTMPDDALHATNYALLAGVRAFTGQKSHMEDYRDG
jgi:hypothetical protein